MALTTIRGLAYTKAGDPLIIEVTGHLHWGAGGNNLWVPDEGRYYVLTCDPNVGAGYREILLGREIFTFQAAVPAGGKLTINLDKLGAGVDFVFNKDQDPISDPKVEEYIASFRLAAERYARLVSRLEYANEQNPLGEERIA